MVKLSKENIIKTIFIKKKELKKKFGIKNIYLFGSYAIDKQTKNSDIDFLIEYEINSKENELKNLDLMIYLEEIFKKDVEAGRMEDLIEDVRNSLSYDNMIKC